MLRAVPPAYAPLSGAALASGLAAALGRGEAARHAVRAHLVRLYEPRRLLLVDSGTSALALALRWGEGAAGPAALPAYGCYDLVTAAQVAGVEARFYDLDPETLQPDPGSVARALRAGATRLVVAHLFGVPVDTRRLRPLLEETGAGLVVEDAAQGFGASVGGAPAGRLGDLTVLSFNRGKGVTGGRGGALLAFGESAGAAGASVPGGDAGWGALAGAAAAWVLARPTLYGLPRSLPFLRLGETVYRPPRPVRAMPDAAAGILSRSVPLAEREVEACRRRGRALAELLTDGEGVRPIPAPAGCEPGFLRLPVLLDGAARAAAPRAVRLGLVQGYPEILPDLPEARALSRNVSEPFPGARELVRSLHTFPTHRRVGGHYPRRVRRWLESAGKGPR